ncbi:MAG: hypothetical protein ACTSQE_15580, partial [Candidatus Heimdallarchaeaceae archaeon]
KGLGVAFAYYVNVSVLLVIYMYFTIKTNKRYTKDDLRKFLLWFIFIAIIAIFGIFYSPQIKRTTVLILVTLINIVVVGIYLIIAKIINIKSLIKDLRTIIKLRLNRKNCN